jgi:hypothetical protein
MQKTAWRLVRSAEDRLGAHRGTEQLLWCVDRLKQQFPKLSNDDAEDYVRSAYIQFRAEQRALV